MHVLPSSLETTEQGRPEIGPPATPLVGWPQATPSETDVKPHGLSRRPNWYRSTCSRPRGRLRSPDHETEGPGARGQERLSTGKAAFTHNK